MIAVEWCLLDIFCGGGSKAEILGSCCPRPPWIRAGHWQ